MSKNKKQKQEPEIITVRRNDGILVSAPIIFFTLASSKKKLNLELVNKLAPGYKLTFVGCSGKDEKSYPQIKEELGKLYKFLSKNQKYSFYSKGNKEKNDSGVCYHPI